VPASKPALWIATAAGVSIACVSPPDGAARVEASLAERVDVAATASAPPLGELQDENALVALALRNNAGFRASLAELGIAEAEWLRAGGLPPVSFSMLFPLGSKQLEYAAKFPVDVIWLRPRRVAAAKRDWEATAERVVQHGLDVVRAVRVACAERAAAGERFAVSKRGAELAFAEFTEKRFRAGAVAENAVAAARVRAAAVSDRAEQEQARMRAAEARLAELTGAARAAPEGCRPRLDAPSQLPSPDALVEQALAARPDLRAAELTLEAAAQRAGLARREIFQLIAVFDANGSGANFEAGPGIELPIPLDGARAARRAADAKLEQAGAGYQAALAAAAREVREAHASASAAASSLNAWQSERMPQLAAWKRRAAAAFETGGIDRGALLEAEIAHDSGTLAATDARFAWRRAHAELERAVGGQIGGAPVVRAPVTTPPANAVSR